MSLHQIVAVVICLSSADLHHRLADPGLGSTRSSTDLLRVLSRSATPRAKPHRRSSRDSLSRHRPAVPPLIGLRPRPLLPFSINFIVQFIIVDFCDFGGICVFLKSDNEFTRSRRDVKTPPRPPSSSAGEPWPLEVDEISQVAIFFFFFFA